MADPKKETLSIAGGMQEAILSRITSETLLRYLTEKGVIDPTEFHEWQKQTIDILAQTEDPETSRLYQIMSGLLK